MTHICVIKLTAIGSDNGLSPGRRQSIIWTNARLLLIWPLGTNVSEMLIEMHISLLKKMHLNMSSARCRPSCLGLNVSMYFIFIQNWSYVIIFIMMNFMWYKTDRHWLHWIIMQLVYHLKRVMITSMEFESTKYIKHETCNSKDK